MIIGHFVGISKLTFDGELLFRSNPSSQYSKVLYHWGVRGRRKIGKSRIEEKLVSFSSASLFPVRKWEAITQGGTRGIDHPMQRKTGGAAIVKSWEDKRDRGHIPDTFT